MIYTLEGGFEQTGDTDSFTKMTTRTELEIYRLLDVSTSKSRGVVDVIHINEDSVVMEHLDIDLCYYTPTDIDLCYYTPTDIKHQMRFVKDYLQSIGIMYIDWKPDNIGISRKDGMLKLFDFDASGVIDLQSNTWTIRPRDDWYSYKNAIDAGMRTPKEIDDYVFDNAF